MQFKRVFWTWSQALEAGASEGTREEWCQGIKNHIIQVYREKRIDVLRVLVVCEQHKDGGWHYHAIARTSKAYRRGRADVWDYQGVHPNIQRMRGLWWQACKYLMKGFCFMEQGGVDDWDVLEDIKKGRQKKSTGVSMHVLTDMIINKGMNPMQIARDDSTGLKEKSLLVTKWTTISAFHQELERARAEDDCAPTPRYDIEDLPMQTPKELRHSPASSALYQIILKKYHPEWPRERNFNREHIYLSSACPGVGKTSITHWVASIVRTATVNCPEIGAGAYWPHVDVEAGTIILEEFGCGQVKMMKLKTLMDNVTPRKPITLRVLNGWRKITHPVTVWILSNSALEEIYPNAKQSERDAVVHRLVHNVHVGPQDTLFPLLDFLEKFKPEEEE